MVRLWRLATSCLAFPFGLSYRALYHSGSEAALGRGAQAREDRHPMTKNNLAAFWIGLAVLLAGLPIAYLSWPARGPDVALIDAQVGGPFELVDQTGRVVTDETFRGRWKLVFFGFTHCPDVCPTTLLDVARILERMGEHAESLQPLFVTLDPERDTPEVLAEYTDFFDSRILGLGGSAGQVKAMADSYNVYVERVPLKDNYLLDHTTFLYLMNRDGELIERFSQQDMSDGVAERIVAHMEER